MSRTNVNFNTYNLSLITGKFEKDQETGKEKFIPNKINDNPSLVSLMYNHKREQIKSREQVLEEELLVCPKVNIDRSVFVKSHLDRVNFKAMKRIHFENMRKNGFNPNKRMNITNPLTMVL